MARQHRARLAMASAGLLALLIAAAGCDSLTGHDDGDGASLAIPGASELAALPLRPHPRLIATEARFAALRDQVRFNPLAKRWYESLKQEADRLVGEYDEPRYEYANGRNLLPVSRRVLEHTSVLALVYHIEQDLAYATAAWRELSAAAAFPDWNPAHFLDTAEMTHAFALGYDWLYDVWREGQRDTLREAMVTLGLQPALEVYTRNSGWTRSSSNWNQVCNSGIGLGALAILDAEPQLASTVLFRALQGLPFAMHSFEPDGAWREGPTYWHYATRYNTYFLAGLETAFGDDFGLSSLPGFSQAGWFPVYLNGSSGQAFNFADASPVPVRGEELLWLAARFGEPAFAAHQLTVEKPTAFDLIWLSPPGIDARLVETFLGKGLQIHRVRSSFFDPLKQRLA